MTYAFAPVVSTQSISNISVAIMMITKKKGYHDVHFVPVVSTQSVSNISVAIMMITKKKGYHKGSLFSWRTISGSNA